MATMRSLPVPEGSGEQQGFDEQARQQLLITARRAAAICGKSLRTWRTWDAAGWIPRPVRIGRSTLWCR